MGIIAQAQAELTWMQAQSVGVRGHYDVFVNDGAGGAVNYSAAINPAPIAAWPDGEGKQGFGRGTFGGGRFGHGDVGLGFGRGCFGLGRFGFGARRIHHVTRPLADGTWVFAVLAFDAAGNPAAPAAGTEVTVALAGEPDPPDDPAATGYDAGTDTLTLEWTLSPDDEG